ncbi:MAG TPA: tetratricopeptide repeat protein [Anaerolineales bacterium]|jgi:tetratricopeptide (TPR) repeat protein|nr:tetratricopeptide repeat protein [Anaerolineales bacterium]
MSLDDFVKKFLDNPNNEAEAKDDIRSLMASHLRKGIELQGQGFLHEAIDEFAKENSRPIKSNIDAEIAQNSYWHLGTIYRKLGDLANAKAAFEQAYDLWKQYHVGTPPHYDLAEILIEQGKIDDAIEICRALLERVPDQATKQLLAKALALKNAQPD